jgi:uncharacterized protein (TIGR02466 family)
MIEKQDIFPTPIYTGSIESFAQINKVIIEKLYELRDMDNAEKKSDNPGWCTNNNLHITLHEIPEFYFLKNCILQAANNIIKTMGYDINLMFNDMWGHINYKFSGDQVHDHPETILCGTYYLKVPKPESNLKLYDPRPVKSFVSQSIAPLDKVKANQYTLNSKTIPLIEGKFIIFPSWLKQAVETNLSDDDRISVIFNFIIDKNPGN